MQKKKNKWHPDKDLRKAVNHKEQTSLDEVIEWGDDTD